MQEYLTAPELAARLKVSEWTIHDWTRRGRIPVQRFSPKVYRYEFQSVIGALESAASKKEAADAR